MRTLLKLSLISSAFLGLAGMHSSTLAQVDNFPTKPITQIVPFPPGGSTDISSRILAEALGKELKQTIVIENKSGASGTIGINQLIRSNADGHTMATLSAPALTAPYILPSVSYDPNKDFKAVGMFYITPIVVTVNPKYQSKITDLASLIEASKNSKDGLNYTTAGVGSTAHLTIETIKKDLGLKLTHIPFRGTAPAVTALLAGEVDFLYAEVAPVLGQIKAGSLKPIAIGTSERFALLPDVPTFKEQNITTETSLSWGGIVVPKDTPDDIVQKLSSSLKTVMENKDIQEKLSSAGLQPHFQDYAKFQQTIATDSGFWAKVIKENDLKQKD
ncbi:Bug family tripartite tricarboxylate transporter substrate binding protein [Pelistega suis]|uniref:Tripartite tricarboxylate transporter substrate binding protein n=1 Tax=Pelistega suis TaxID=1631957 RepID=A0A849PA00_9BURK|nr:tripartite tricarboxylate transporter substrate binding protein [Pelistega suis]NOL52552.1 tripartite tricarboxylate transporter substrate binding protein [Pelistega suis]